MNEKNITPQFEEEIRQAFFIPPVRSEFVNQLYSDLNHHVDNKPNQTIRFGGFRPTRLAIITIFSLVFISILIISPQRVVEAVRSLIGYIPGVGLVDQNAPIRVLAEPVTITRDEISITVVSAILTGDQTFIEYRIFGVPASAYPNNESQAGCTTTEYLLLPDATRLDRVQNGFEPVPQGINSADLVLPCIFNTLPGTTPENWEFPLRFTAAPPDLTVMPVTEISPTPQAFNTQHPLEESNPTSAPTANPVTISKEIKTEDGYILVGQFQPHTASGESFQLNGAMHITDVSGKTVSYSYPQDVNEALSPVDGGNFNFGWAAQFDAAGLAYPLTVQFSGTPLFPADPEAIAIFTFDAGPNPQPGQKWTPNQNIQLAGHTLKLISIVSDSREGYSFQFKVDPNVSHADLQIMDYMPVGSGGGSDPDNGIFTTSLSYAQLPAGEVTIVLSNLILIGDPVTYQQEWSPASPRTDLPADPTPQPGLCLTADALLNVPPAPEMFSNGKALIYEKLDTGTWGLAVYNLDGSQKQIVVPNGNWGSLSPDGSQVAYSSTDNSIHIVELATQTEFILPGTGGFNLHWSPDGNQIAYIGMGSGTINSVFVINTDGSNLRQISDLSYESIVGWGPDENQLLYAVPYTGGAAWKVYVYDFLSETSTEMFTIENGTPKFLNPKLSSDGNWIVYRGQDNSSLYRVRTDGSNMHLLIDNINAVGIEWSRSGWLGISLQKENPEESTVVIIKPDDCTAYVLPPALHGQLEGLFVP